MSMIKKIDAVLAGGSDGRLSAAAIAAFNPLSRDRLQRFRSYLLVGQGGPHLRRLLEECPALEDRLIELEATGRDITIGEVDDLVSASPLRKRISDRIELKERLAHGCRMWRQ